MNEHPTTAPDGTRPAPRRATHVVEDVAAALRLPGPLGRERERLPVAPAAPLIPTALSIFNALTGRLDQGVPADAPPAEIAELPAAPLRALPTRARRARRG